LGHTDNVFIPTLVDFGNQVIKDVTCGFFHCNVVTKNNLIFSFGHNRNKQLGDNFLEITLTPELNRGFTETKDFKSIVSNGQNTFIIVKNKVLSIGKNNFGELGIGKYTDYERYLNEIQEFSNKNITMMKGNSEHSIFIVDDVIFSFGYNYVSFIINF
jgi:alpha-tubulin suppressor-like RCC1 family protein